MKLHLNSFVTYLSLAVSTISVVVHAHVGGNDGHVPPDVNYGFTLIGRDTLGGVKTRTYTDVWSYNGYAYVGTYRNANAKNENQCTSDSVYIVDMQAAVQQYSAGNIQGAVVAEIKPPPSTYVNDVKVHKVGDTDVLIMTQEPCGKQIPGYLQKSDGGPPFQSGQGGISLYDVTDPTKPHVLRKNFLEFGGVHNTYPWTDPNTGKSYVIGATDKEDLDDIFIADITAPQSPKFVTLTGANDWISQGLNLDQLGTGDSTGIFVHDVIVKISESGTPFALVSYWDLGFVTLDLTDPANPVFLDDSNYPELDPINNAPYEGNAHVRTKMK